MLCSKAFEEISIGKCFLVFIYSFTVFKVFQIDIPINDKTGCLSLCRSNNWTALFVNTVTRNEWFSDQPPMVEIWLCLVTMLDIRDKEILF